MKLSRALGLYPRGPSWGSGRFLPPSDLRDSRVISPWINIALYIFHFLIIRYGNEGLVRIPGEMTAIMKATRMIWGSDLAWFGLWIRFLLTLSKSAMSLGRGRDRGRRNKRLMQSCSNKNEYWARLCYRLRRGFRAWLAGNQTNDSEPSRRIISLWQVGLRVHHSLASSRIPRSPKPCSWKIRTCVSCSTSLPGHLLSRYLCTK